MKDYTNSDFMPVSYNVVEALESILIRLDIVNEDDQWGIDETEDYALELNRQSETGRYHGKLLTCIHDLIVRNASRRTYK